MDRTPLKPGEKVEHESQFRTSKLGGKVETIPYTHPIPL
jgi:hypothetical protein